MIRHFDSVADLRAEAIRTNAAPWHGTRADEWFSYETPEVSLSRAQTGNVDLVPEAEKIINQLETNIEVDSRVVDACVAGGWPSVPDALAGRPLAMRRLIHVGDEHAPIHIYVNVTSSAGVSEATLRNRGCTILALVMALTRIRPVSLNVVNTLDYYDDPDGHGESVLVTKINTAPLDLATACWTLTSQGFSRRLNYGICKRLYNYRGSWPREFKHSDGGKSYMKYLQGRLVPGQEAHSLMIAPVSLLDNLVKDPVSWVNDQIKRFTQAEKA